VANEQRRNIYQLRNDILYHDDLSAQVKALRDGVVEDLFRTHIPAESLEEQWDVEGLKNALQAELGLPLPLNEWVEGGAGDEQISQNIIEAADKSYAERMSIAPPDIARQIERSVLLQTLDVNWREHLAALDHLRQGIHLRGYAQKDPKQEYKREAFELFGALVETVKLETTRILMRVQLQTQEQVEEAERFEQRNAAIQNLQFHHPSADGVLNESDDSESRQMAAEAPKATPVVRGAKIGRNEPCPCGSGKKYKQCHGKLQG
jgi:preprotein translocase subunit SecA